VVGLGPIRLGEDQRDVSLAAVGNEDLATGYPVDVAVADGQHVLVPRVGAGLGLGEGEAAKLLTHCRRGEKAPLLLLRAELVDGVAVQRVVDRHDDGVGRAGPGDLLECQRIGHGVAAAAAVRLGDGDAHEPERAHSPHRLVGEAGLAIDDLGDGTHLFLRELARHRLDHPLLVAQLDMQA